MFRSSIVAWMGVVLLAGCGGSSKTITGLPTTTTTTTDPVAKVTVTASPSTIAADGSTTSSITAIALDANNAGVSGAVVTFGSSAGGTVAVVTGTTDTTGKATATLSNLSAAAGTNITVTAASGGVSGNVVVGVVSIQQTITLTTSIPQIPSDGSKVATITALVRNANNQFVSGVPVSFVATSGGLTVTQATTDVNGMATATLSAASDPTNRLITVTATAGTSTATVPVSVTGTSLTVVGPPNLVQGAQGTYTISLTNSSTAGIPNVTVTLKSANGNALSSTSILTGSTGQNTVTLTATNAGSDTLTATALGMTAGQAISVSNQSFLFTTPSTATTNVDLGVSQPLTVTWTVGGVPQANQTVNFAATRGTLSAATATTNASGQATVTVTSAVAGPAIMTASATGVTTQTAIEFIATVPASIDVQASPATIPTQGQSTITAVVRDALNNLVEGQTVDFTTVNDITGGTLSVASAVTDSQGVAQTVYTASVQQSASNGVVVQATVQGTAVTKTADLTVGGLTVFLSLGTGNQIGENATKTQFILPYTVLALDSAGNAVANVPITLTIHPLYYYKGGYCLTTTSWEQSGTPKSCSNGGVLTLTPVTACPNEDASFNGVYSKGEDGYPGYPDFNPFGNQNGKLDPGGTAVTSPGSVTTGTDGSVNFTVVYPESEALWVDVQLIATATVSGTETTASATFVLPILASYLTTTTASPPGDPSPYGIATICTNPN